MTESAETTSSSSAFCGGSGARAGSCAARSSACEGAALVSAAAGAAGVGDEGELDVAGGGVEPLLLGQLRSSVGGASCRCVPAGAAFVSCAALRDGASGRLVGAGPVVFDAAARGAGVAAFVSPITASVSWTGRSGIVVGGSAVDAGAVVASDAVGVTFVRDAT